MKKAIASIHYAISKSQYSHRGSWPRIWGKLTNSAIIGVFAYLGIKGTNEIIDYNARYEYNDNCHCGYCKSWRKVNKETI